MELLSVPNQPLGGCMLAESRGVVEDSPSARLSALHSFTQDVRRLNWNNFIQLSDAKIAGGNLRGLQPSVKILQGLFVFANGRAATDFILETVGNSRLQLTDAFTQLLPRSADVVTVCIRSK